MSSPASVHTLHPGAYMQCTTWLMEGPTGLVLVDPGAGGEEERLLANLALLGFSPEQVTHALITHSHADHAMGAGRLRRFGAKVVASQPVIEAPCDRYCRAMAVRRADRRTWGRCQQLLPGCGRRG